MSCLDATVCVSERAIAALTSVALRSGNGVIIVRKIGELLLLRLTALPSGVFNQDCHSKSTRPRYTTNLGSSSDVPPV